MKTKEEILQSHYGSDYWLLTVRDELKHVLRAMDEYAAQFKPNEQQGGVSGKRPTDDEITLVISEIANHFNSGLSNSLHQEYYITKVRELFQAACASSAVDKTVSVDKNEQKQNLIDLMKTDEEHGMYDK